MAAFVLKTEPSTYSFQDLVREKRTVWDGITNPVALKHLRTVERGDTLLIYHTGDEKQVVGVAKAASAAFADPKAGDPKRAVVEIVPVRPLKRAVTLAEIRSDPTLKTTELVRIPRLSVIPLTDKQLERIEKLSEAK